MPKSGEEWTKFRETYVARQFRNMGFSIHTADPANSALIFKE